MDEFSDFQMAVASAGPGPGPSPHGHKDNRGLSGGKGGGFHWGVQKQQSPKFMGGSNLPTGPTMGPTSAAPAEKVDKNVGSRLANYDLGRKVQPGGVSQQGFPNNVPPPTPTPVNHCLLIGEEDKYAALRALVSLEVSDEPSKTALFSGGPSEKRDGSNPSFVPLPHNVEEAKGDDFSDFGDFQSFSNPSSSHPPFANSTADNSFKIPCGVNNNGPLMSPPTLPPAAYQVPQFDFGDFGTIPDYANASTDFLEIRDLNNSVLSQESSNIFIADPSPHNFTNLSTDLDDMSSLNFCDVSVNYGDTPLHNDALFSNHHLQSSNNEELPGKNSFQIVDNLPPAPPVSCYVESSSMDIESASTPISSNIPPPVSFIKTSLIGCDVGRISSDIENLEFTSASLMETSNDVLEYIPSHEKNRFDISPETRSIASLDLGNYCPTFDVPEGKSSADNMWNGSMSGSSSNNSKQSQENGNGDSFDPVESGSNHEIGSDKYQCFREDLQMETNAHELIWSRCLESVKQIINVAVELFSPIGNNSAIIGEVVLSGIGENYVDCLYEVHQVFSRIKLSHNRDSRIEKLKLKELCAEIDRFWETLASVLDGTRVLEKLNTSTTATESCGNGLKRCGICLCSVEDVQFSYVEYNEVLYHSGCANLWLNNVDTRLPSLSAFGMQLDENVTYQNTCH